MLYRTGEYVPKYKSTIQTFSEFEPDYTYDSKNRCLQVTGERNIQEIIQSNADCALSCILDKFLPEDIVSATTSNVVFDDDDEVVDVNYFDLATNAEILDDFRSLKERFNISPDMTYAEIKDIINQAVEKEKGVEENGKIQEKKLEKESE